MKEQGWNLYDYYCDDGVSGTTFDRPQFNRLVQDATDGKINLILCKDLSRLGRDYIEAGRYTDYIFPSLGCRFIALNDGVDTIHKNNEMMVILKNVMNDLYARDTSNKIKAVKRNWIAVIAIALTALLFTSLFTILLSVNASYQTYQFRQLGGYMHGTFKKVTPQQIEAISAHRLVREAGVRTVVGTTSDGVFAKEPAEISYMDENCTRWSYATPTIGRLPETGKEITMDTKALALLGINPELGAEIPLTYTLYDGMRTGETVTDTFTLVGWWDYDDLMAVHFINISRDYVEQAKTLGEKRGIRKCVEDLKHKQRTQQKTRGIDR